MLPMSILPSELTLIELCDELNTTAPWVSKALRDFNFPREGRGKLRKFRREEAVVLRNIKMLLKLGFSLVYLQDLQKEEAGVRNQIDKAIRLTEKSVKEGKEKTSSVIGGKYIIFLLNFPLETNWDSYSRLVDGKEEWVDFWDEVEGSLNEKFPFHYLKDISDRIDKLSSEMKTFKDNLEFTYKPNLNEV